MTTKAKLYICRRKIKHENPQQQQQQNVKYNKKKLCIQQKNLCIKSYMYATTIAATTTNDIW